MDRAVFATCFLAWGLLDTHRQVWFSLLWGHCSFLLAPGAHKALFVPSKSLHWSYQNTLFQQHKRRLYTWTSPDGQHWNQIDYVFCSQRWRSSIQSTKTRSEADCGSDHALLIAKFRLKLKKVGKTARPFRYDLNQIPYDYTVEVRNRFKGLDLIECLINYGMKFVLNAEFQRIARRDKKAYLRDQCKEIEENNRMGKTRDCFKKIKDTKGAFHFIPREHYWWAQ